MSNLRTEFQHKALSNKKKNANEYEKRKNPNSGQSIPNPHSEPFSHLRCGNGSQTYLNLYIFCI